MIPKFRAFYKDNMYSVAKFDLWGDPDQATCDLAPFYPKFEDEFDVYLHEVKLMQSTHLKDKNGVEVFEGDVISELSEQGEDWANHILAEVVWHKVGFYGKEKGHEPEYPITEFVKGEVIGNIYENPELLEVAE